MIGALTRNPRSPARRSHARSSAPKLALCALFALAGLLVGLDDPGSAEAQERRGLPLPRFEAARLDGGVGSSDLLMGRWGLLYLFATTDSDANQVAALVQRIAPDASAANVAIVGIARDLDPTRVQSFSLKHGFEFPILVDRDLTISRKMGPARPEPGHSAVYVVDSRGEIVSGFRELSTDLPNPYETYEAILREALHLRAKDAVATPELGVLPEAPPFRVESLDGEVVTLEDLRGKVTLLIFFSPTCPHCHKLMKFVQKLEKQLEVEKKLALESPTELENQPPPGELAIVPVSVIDRPYVIRDQMKQQGIQLRVFIDPGEATQKAYAHRASVPDALVIDREGRIISRRSGSAPRGEALLAMELRHALAVPNKLLLSRDGYSGEDTCRICHAQQHGTWALTNHAYAFETLVEHGQDRNPECLPCHTVGWEQKGGYSLETPFDYLEGVQCESCHGRGGSHQSPEFVKQGYEQACLGCHNEKHSLHFVFTERLPQVSHAANVQFANLSVEERLALLERRDKRERPLFDKGVFVGSAACQSCHLPQFDVWAAGPHAETMKSLHEKNEAANDACLRCHTTGFGETGGYPEGGELMLNVGCESCHGPGGTHVAEDPPLKGTILALADKCDSCVIMQICGSCHDEEWDKDFEFKLEERLDKIRHATPQTANAQP